MTEEQKQKEDKKAKERMRKRRSEESEKVKTLRKKADRERKFFYRQQKKLTYKCQEVEANSLLDDNQKCFDNHMKGLHWYTCPICNKKQLVSATDDKPCKKCEIFTLENDLDPGDAPDELTGLSITEQVLIARIHPVILLYKIKNAQLSYSGNVISFPQNIQEVVTELPHSIPDMKGLIAIRAKNSDGHIDFTVRKSKVLNALTWLKENNPHYKDINISEENLDVLPENGSVYHLIRGYDIEGEEIKIDKTDKTGEGEDEAKNAKIEYQDIPHIGNTENEKLLNNLDGQVLIWPTIGKVPINEFGSPGYISMCFPHLFPKGLCDYSMRKDKLISFPEYVKHLMLYKDERFAKDPRFRFFMLNSQLRWDSLNLGNVFVKKNAVFSSMTLIQLKEFLKNNPKAINYIMFFSSRLRSTKAYWMSRSSELSDMIDSLGPATVFFTLSFPDYYCKELFRILGCDNVNTLPMHERINLISQNPLTVATFFKIRSEFFIEHCMKEHFDVVDSWYRVEHQSRGTPHIHGLLWLKDAPDIRNIEDSKEKQDAAKAFFDKIITCENPDINYLGNVQHPCEKNVSDVTNIHDDLVELVNTVQRHTKCPSSYCSKKDKKGNIKCRFGFPKDMQEETSVTFKKGAVDIEFKRNDKFVNKYNRWVLQTWRGNIDFSPVFSERILQKYISKYTSKCEYKSQAYNDLVSSIARSSTAENEHCKKAIKSLMIKTISERDYTATEVMYLLMGFALYHSTRQFVVLNLRNVEWELFNFRNTANKNFFDHYRDRPEDMSQFSVIEMAKWYYFRNGRWVKRKKAAVVRCFPRLDIKRHLTFQDLRCQCIFHVPWRSMDVFDISTEELQELLVNKNITLANIAFEEDDIILEWQSDSSNSENESDDDDSNKKKKKYSRISYVSNSDVIKDHKSDQLGFRQIDKEFDWSYGVTKFDYIRIQNTYDTVKELEQNTAFPYIDYKKFHADQENVFNFFCTQLELMQTSNCTSGKVILVQAKAGYGKSYLLNGLRQKVLETFGEGSCLSLGPTGVSARSVFGRTIHSWGRIPKNSSFFKVLEGENIKLFQSQNERLRVVLLDEFSMIGCRLLAMFEQRCREAKDNNALFGNLLIFLFGDIYQLAPIGDKPMFSNLEGNYYSSLTQRGKMLVQSLFRVFFLDKPKRFKSNEYSDFLNRLSEGNCLDHDVDAINNRFYQKLKHGEVAKFDNTVRIAYFNNEVTEHNNVKLVALEKPVARICAENSSSYAFNSSDDMANGLSNVIYLSIGSKVMLRYNMNVNFGLVNGSVGVITEILYEDDCSPPYLPTFVIVKFDGISGFEDLMNGIPIKPIHTSWYTQGKHCTRFQLPLTLCWASTVHKSQSLTLHKIQLNIGKFEFELGLIYVALSRVSDYSDLLMMEIVTLDRLNCVKGTTLFLEKQEFMKFLYTLK